MDSFLKKKKPVAGLRPATEKVMWLKGGARRMRRRQTSTKARLVFCFCNLRLFRWFALHVCHRLALVAVSVFEDFSSAVSRVLSPYVSLLVSFQDVSFLLTYALFAVCRLCHSAFQKAKEDEAAAEEEEEDKQKKRSQILVTKLKSRSGLVPTASL